jgi:hypothetical protein
MTIADDAGAGIGFFAIFFIIWFAIAIGSLVLMIVALVDIARRPDWQWKLAGQEKILWLLLVILVNLLAIPSLIYWFNIRKKLQAVEAAAANGQYGPGHMTYAGWEPFPAALPISAMAPAGWYPDAAGQARLRWWDGAQWTNHTSDGGPPSM